MNALPTQLNTASRRSLAPCAGNPYRDASNRQPRGVCSGRHVNAAIEQLPRAPPSINSRVISAWWTPTSMTMKRAITFTN